MDNTLNEENKNEYLQYLKKVKADTVFMAFSRNKLFITGEYEGDLTFEITYFNRPGRNIHDFYKLIIILV